MHNAGFPSTFCLAFVVLASVFAASASADAYGSSASDLDEAAASLDNSGLPDKRGWAKFHGGYGKRGWNSFAGGYGKRSNFEYVSPVFGHF